jgi:hypothetical protein
MSDQNILLSQCHKCARPLGQESKDLGYIVCHECRKCDVCHEDVGPTEVEALTSYSHVIRHANCSLKQMLIENGNSNNWDKFEPTQYQLQVLNIATLINPNMDISRGANKAIIDMKMDSSIGGLPIEVTLRIVQNMEVAAASMRGALRKATNKSKETLEEEQRVKEIQQQNLYNKNNKVRETKNKPLTNGEHKESEAIIEKEHDQSLLIKQSNRQRFFEMAKLDDIPSNSHYWDNFILILKKYKLVDKKVDSNKVQFTEHAFERGYKLLRDMGFINS